MSDAAVIGFKSNLHFTSPVCVVSVLFYSVILFSSFVATLECSSSNACAIIAINMI